MSSRTVTVDVEGRRLTLSNLDKVLYPATGTTKAEVIDYYRRIAPVLLPYLRDRPPTLVRAPDGVAGERFFEKRCPPHHPEWVRTDVVGAHEGRAGFAGCRVDDLPTLVWLANLAALEFHTHQARVVSPDAPDAIVFDLDPGPGAGLVDCARVALELRDQLADHGLAVSVKSSGGAGLHLGVPLRDHRMSADEAKRFARDLGLVLERADPARVTTTMAKRARTGRVFVDWSQNDRHKTTVAPYSLRIRDRPWVSAPLHWDEVEAAVAGADAGALRFDVAAVLARVERDGDLWRDVLPEPPGRAAPA